MTLEKPYTHNYDTAENKYAGHRRTDPRIAEYVHRALGDARTVVNVGAGTGSYEPTDKYVIAVEPSATMRAMRGRRAVPAINGSAENIPLDDKSVDAAMAMVTIHHWADIERGLLELKRVARQRVVIMTFDGDALHEFWNIEYFPEVVAMEKRRYPDTKWVTGILGNVEIVKIPIPLNCVDGFQEAFYGRPEAFLDPSVRKAQSAWGFLTEAEQEPLVQRLADDLSSGAWDRKYGHLRTQPTFTGALRLFISYLD
jgi:SAM-dependent methyltransferase